MGKKIENKEPTMKVELQNESKKPFDKKIYRLKKYSNKYKLEQWEEQRKKKLLRNYYKEMKNDPMAGSYRPISFDDNKDVGKFVRHPNYVQEEVNRNKPKSAAQKARENLNKIKEEKLLKQQEIQKATEERQQKTKEYLLKKKERFKKLSKKTKRGQPVMTGRLELLLQKIQKG